MFSYFGSKSKIVHLYQPPLHDLIIEPFAGSARYALKYHRKQVWLNDASPVICRIWEWIINATKEDIRTLPVLKKGESVADCKQLSQVEKDMLGFCVAWGCAQPHHVVTGWGAINGQMHQFKRDLLRWAGKLRHWKVTNLSYDELPNQPATWFIDPPYQEMGHRYTHHTINFSALGEWCQQRQGQVMVCEGGQADWLPFVPLVECKRIRRKDTYRELIWYRSDRKIGFGLF